MTISICPANLIVYLAVGLIGIFFILRLLRTQPVLLGFQFIYLLMGIGIYFAYKHIAQMESIPYKSLWIGILAGTAAFFVLWMGSRYSEARLQDWADENRYKLIDFKRGAFWEGPKAWTRSKYQNVYRITIQDEQGRQRLGWILFGDYWGTNPRKAEWRFDDDA